MSDRTPSRTRAVVPAPSLDYAIGALCLVAVAVMDSRTPRALLAIAEHVERVTGGGLSRKSQCASSAAAPTTTTREQTA